VARFPGGEYVDIIGFDIYNPYGSVKNGKANTHFKEMKEAYDRIAVLAVKHNVDWAIAESGISDSAYLTSGGAGWMQRAYDDMKHHPVKPGVAFAYFSSVLNSSGSWSLDSSAGKKSAFIQVLKKSD
jgi:hypothetical protein